MNIVRIIIGFLFTMCGTTLAQILHPKYNYCQGSSQEMEQRILNDMKLHFHGFLSKITDSILAEITETRNVVTDLKSSHRALEQKCEKIDSDLTQVKSDFASEVVERQAANQKMTMNLSTLNLTIGNELRSLNTKIHASENLMVEFENKILNMEKNLSVKLMEGQDVTNAMQLLMKNEINETLSHLSSDLTRKADEIDIALQEVRTDLLTMNSSVMNLNYSLDNEVHSLYSKLEEVQNIREKMQDMYDRNVAMDTMMGRKINGINRTLEDLIENHNATKADMCQKLEQMNSSMSLLNESFSESLLERDTAVNQKIGELSIEMTNTIRQVQLNVTMQMDEIKERQADIEFNAKVSENKSSELEKNIAILNENLTTFGTAFGQKIDKSVDQITSDLRLLRENDSFLKKNVSSLSSEAEQARASHIALSTEVQVMKGTQADLEQLVDQLNKNTYAIDITGLKSSVANIKTQMMRELSLLMENDTFIMEEMTSLLTDAEQARASHTALSTEVKGIEGNQEALKQLVNQMKTNTYASDIIGLKTSVSNMKTQITGLQNDERKMTNNYNALSSTIKSGFTGLNSSVSDINLRITGLTNQGRSLSSKVTSNYNSLNSRINSARSLANTAQSQANTAQSLANTANNFAKGRNLRCSWTSYQNGFDRTLSYIVPSGYVIRGIYSYHMNHYEDRRFKFYICR